MKIKIILLFSILLMLFGCTTNNTSAINNETDTDLEVHFLDIGQGDCILVKNDGFNMLIDAGDNSQGTKIQKYLQDQNIKTINYVIGTHPDADHIGGLDVILHKFDCKNIFLPDIENDTRTYQDVKYELSYNLYIPKQPDVGETFKFGDATFEILGPIKTYDDINNNSIVIKLTHGNNTFLFMGDAEVESENDLILNSDLDADVLKVGHHGSNSSTSYEFIKEVTPEYAIISCGINNTYGHPHEETLNTLKQNDVNLFRTDVQGTVVAISDEKNITWNSEPDNSWTAGEPIIDSLDNNNYYVLNNNSLKIHIPTCSSIEQMNNKNKEFSYLTIEELLSSGYEKCKICFYN